MKKILFAIFILFVWTLGIYEGDCTAAVFLSMFGICPIADKLKQRRGKCGKQGA